MNRTWRVAIVGSVKLQRKLFLAPEKDIEVVALMHRPPPWKQLLLAKYVERDNTKAEESRTICLPVVLNPLLFFNSDVHNQGRSLSSPSAAYADLLAHSRLPYHNIGLLLGLCSGSLSHSACLEMFLTQPPVCEVRVELNILKCLDCDCETKKHCCFILRRIKNSKGLRVRDIFAAARSFHIHFPCRKGDALEEVTSISIAFKAVAHGSYGGVLLLTAEDMRLARAEALNAKLEASDFDETAGGEEQV